MLALAGVKWVVAAAAGLSGLAIAGLLGWHDAVQADALLRRVELPGHASLFVAVREVTRRQWKTCAEAGACEDLTGPIHRNEPDKPMTGVNHLDVEAYLGWINASQDRRYRLPTSEEWNVIAADLPHKPYKKLFTDPRLAWAADYGSMEKVSAVVRPSGAFGSLPNGIADLGGNVWEWTSTCTSAEIEPSNCPAYHVEGLHETVLSVFVRDPASGGCAVGAPPANVGVRLVSDEE